MKLHILFFFALSVGTNLLIGSQPFQATIEPRENVGSELLLTWPSKTGKVYKIESASNNLDEFSQSPKIGMQATNPTNKWWAPAPQSGESRFYRVVESEQNSANFSGPRAAAHFLNQRLHRGNNFMAAKAMNKDGALQDYELLKESHFSHCRIGYKLDEVAGPSPEHIIPANELSALRQMVDWCLSQGLIAIVNPVHNWANNNDPMMEYEDTATNRLKLRKIWEQVATEFANDDLDLVVFEVMNEPHHEDDVARIIEISLSAIRGVPGNEQRIVIVPGDGFSTRQAFIDALDEDQIPANDPYLIGTFHYYDPRDFTKQADSVDGVSWGSQSDFSAVSQAFDEVVQANARFASRHGTDPLPVYLGEFGVDNAADLRNDDREKWLSWIRMQAEARGFSWAHWNMYNNAENSKGMGPWSFAEKNNPELRSFDPAPLEALTGHYEFENGSKGGEVSFESTEPGFSGSAYAKYPLTTAVGTWARVDSIYVPKTDTYKIKIHYACDTDRTVRLVTTAQTIQNVLFPSSGGNNSWATLEIEIDFNASTSHESGNESLKIVAVPDPGPQLDWMTISAPSP